MIVDQGEWVLSEGEMASVAASFGLKPLGLGAVSERLPAPADAEAAVKAFEALDPVFRALAERCLRALAGAKKIVNFHNSLDDERVSRCLLAWHPDMGGAWVSLARTGDLRRVSLRTEVELRYQVASSLSADDSLRADRLSLNLATPEALALLAAFDQLRRARLISLLGHAEPVTLFGAEDVRVRLEGAWVEDFRWTLPFLAKLLPLPIADLAVAKDARPALLGLEKAGLLERVGSIEDKVLCELTGNGTFLEAGFRECSSRAALSVTMPVQSGLAHDVFLFVRSVFDLFSLSLSGGDATLSTIQAGELDELLKRTFAPPPPAAEKAPSADAGAEATLILANPMIQARVVVEAGPLAGQAFQISDGSTVGRQGDNQIVVNDPGISRKHARFSRNKLGVWFIEDLGSSNGTLVNDSKSSGPTPLQPGDHIRIANTVLAFDPPKA